MFNGLGVVLSTLRVVVGQVADQGELDIRHPAFDQTISIDHTERVLPGIVARDLSHQGPIAVDPESTG